MHRFDTPRRRCAARRDGAPARRLVRTALLAAALVAGGCAETPEPLGPDDSGAPAGNPGPAPARVLVVNTLSETLSALDLGTGAMTVRAADLGAAPNRVTALWDGSGVIVTASGDNRAEVRGAHDLAPRLLVDLGPGSNPWTVASFSAVSALATSWLSGDILRVDLVTGSTGPRLGTTPGPEGVAVVGGRAFVACTNYQGATGTWGEGRVDVVDLSAWRVIASVAVGANPQEAAVDAAGRIHVLCTGTYGVTPEQGSVHVIDPATLQVVGVVPLGGSPGRLCAGSGDVMWVVGYVGGLRRYDAATLQLLPDPTDPALTASDLSAVAWDEETDTAYVASFGQDRLMAVTGTTPVVTASWIVGDGPVDVLVLRPE